MPYDDPESFAAALDRAGREYLVSRGVAPGEEFRFQVEDCPVHGLGCVRVTYGMLREHVDWAGTDVRAAAATMLGTMLPPQAAADGIAGPSPEDEPTPTAGEYARGLSATPCDRHEVVEFVVPLTAGQADALLRASCRQGLAAGQFMRLALMEILHRAELKSPGEAPTQTKEAV
jgi:hypothetical protein